MTLHLAPSLLHPEALQEWGAAAHQRLSRRYVVGERLLVRAANELVY